ncbi:MAG: transcriptional regulator FtrA, partial [Pseudolabrys sp.]
ISVEQVATEAGFGTAAALRLHFRRALRTSPQAYRETFASSIPYLLSVISVAPAFSTISLTLRIGSALWR